MRRAIVGTIEKIIVPTIEAFEIMDRQEALKILASTITRL
jgi:hypothetical protein